MWVELKQWGLSWIPTGGVVLLSTDPRVSQRDVGTIYLYISLSYHSVNVVVCGSRIGPYDHYFWTSLYTYVWVQFQWTKICINAIRYFYMSWNTVKVLPHNHQWEGLPHELVPVRARFNTKIILSGIISIVFDLRNIVRKWSVTLTTMKRTDVPFWARSRQWVMMHFICSLPLMTVPCSLVEPGGRDHDQSG